MLITLWAAAVSVVTFADVASVLRAFVALPFLVLVPGMAWVRLLRLDSYATTLVLGVAVSLALETAVACGMLYADVWSPRASLAVLVVVTLMALVTNGMLETRRRRPSLPGS